MLLQNKKGMASQLNREKDEQTTGSPTIGCRANVEEQYK